MDPRDIAIPDSASEAAHQAADSLIGTVHGVALDFAAQIPLLCAGVVVLLLTWGVVAVFRRSADRLLARTELRGSLRELIERLSVIAIWGLGLTLTAMVIFPGLTPTRALGGLGIASVAVGFAFKDIFENFFAGILILWRFPLERGDFIACQDIMGRVEDVTVRMTQIRKPTGELVVIPNGFLFKNPVEVLTYESKRRSAILASVAYGEDVSEAVEVIRDAVASCDTVAAEPEVEIFPTSFGESSIDIEVAWWTDPSPLDERRSRGEVVMAVKQALDEAGIEIPFPYRTLTFKQPLRLAGEEADRGTGAASGAPA